MINDIIQNLRLSFCKDRELYVSLRSIIGFFPKDIKPYKEALTHRSAMLKDERGRDLNNERLEYLGDALLDAVVADILFKHFDSRHEGFLTSTRAKIVQREHLNKVGANIGLQKLMIFNTHSQSHNSYLYGNALEALVGAIYLDRGYDYVMRFVLDKVIDHSLEEFAEDEQNYKSRLIEWSQRYKLPIEFNLTGSYLDEHKSPVFRSAITINGEFIAEGEGYTKKESHQVAAKVAFTRLHTDEQFRERIMIETIN